MNPIRVKLNGDNTLRVRLGYDVSGSTFTSQVRKGRGTSTDLLFSFTCVFENDGTDGVLLLSVTKTALVDVNPSKGWFDIKRNDGVSEYALCDPYPVKIEEGVTE